MHTLSALGVGVKAMSIMRFQGSKVSLGVAAMTMVVVTAACNSGTVDGPKSGLPVVLSGASRTPPHVEGEWRVNTTVTVDTCGSALVPLVNSYVVRIDQAGSNLSAVVFDHCGTELATATGTSEFTQVVSLSFKQSAAISSACTLTSEQEWTGTVQPDLNTIVGGRTLTLTGAGPCGAGLPCGIDGALTAVRCARGVCAFDNCAP
jgi:hypothetical protein